MSNKKKTKITVVDYEDRSCYHFHFAFQAEKHIKEQAEADGLDADEVSDRFAIFETTKEIKFEAREVVGVDVELCTDGP